MELPADKLAQARTWIRLHRAGFVTAYPRRVVNNLYLDTPDLNSLNANLQGVGSRQKLRLRWYGRSQSYTIAQPTLELKYKDNMLGNKKQEQLECELDLRWEYGRWLKTIWQAASPSWQHWLSAASQPTLLNSYQREYFVTPDGEIRATLDYDLRVFGQRTAAKPNLSTPSQLEPAIIVEVKCTPNQAERLEEVMAEFPVQRRRYSKYVNGALAGNL